MKGLFVWVGFKSVTVGYDRKVRSSETTKWNNWKLWNFALDGITSFTTLPLRVWSYIGALLALISFLYGSWIVIKTIFSGVIVPGYASIFVAILFIGGIQLIGIGILGEYIGRIYQETKQRPIYIIKKVVEL